MALDQTDYRWENDDGSESASTFTETVNTTTDVTVTGGDVNLRLRLAVFDDGENVISSGQLEFSINGGGYNNLTNSSTGCIYYNSGNLTDGDDCTQRITATSFATTNEGVIETGAGGIAEFNGSGTEHLYTITFIAADLVNNDSINFRMTDPSSYTNTGNATITKGGGGGGGRIMSSLTNKGGLAGGGGIAGQGGGLAG